MSSPRRNLSKNIAFLRKRRKLTQTDLADRIGSKKSTIGAYEENRSSPSIKTIVYISDFFGISIDDLLKLDLEQVLRWQDEILKDERNTTLRIVGDQ